MENNCKIVMLPTQDKSILYISDNILQRSSASLSSLSINRNLKNQHLYIVNDDKIQEGDWSYHTNQKSIIQIGTEFELMDRHLYLKKVVATTDIYLTYAKRIRADVRVSKSLPQPSQQFIEKYIESYNKGVILSDVLVEYEEYDPKRFFTKGKSLLPDVLKINPDNTINIRQQKASWSRDEVDFTLNTLLNQILISKRNLSLINNPDSNKICYFLNKWTKENL